MSNLNAPTLTVANVDPEECFDSVIVYTCPRCQAEHELEPDAGIITCDCGIRLMCDIMYCV